MTGTRLQRAWPREQHRAHEPQFSRELAATSSHDDCACLTDHGRRIGGSRTPVARLRGVLQKRGCSERGGAAPSVAAIVSRARARCTGREVGYGRPRRRWRRPSRVARATRGGVLEPGGGGRGGPPSRAGPRCVISSARRSRQAPIRWNAGTRSWALPRARAPVTSSPSEGSLGSQPWPTHQDANVLAVASSPIGGALLG